MAWTVALVGSDPVPALRALAWYGLARIFALVWAVVILGASPDVGDDRSLLWLFGATAGLWFALLLAPLLAVAGWRRQRWMAKPDPADLVPRAPLRLRSLAMFGLAGIALQLVVLPLLNWPLIRLFDLDPSSSATALFNRADTTAELVVLSVSVVLVAPVVEEVMYRGFLFPSLAGRLGTPVAAVVVSLVFALVHQDPAVMPSIMVLSLFLCWATARRERLMPAVATHGAFNATALLTLLLG